MKDAGVDSPAWKDGPFAYDHGVVAELIVGGVLSVLVRNKAWGHQVWVQGHSGGFRFLRQTYETGGAAKQDALPYLRRVLLEMVAEVDGLLCEAASRSAGKENGDHGSGGDATTGAG